MEMTPTPSSRKDQRVGALVERVDVTAATRAPRASPAPDRCWARPRPTGWNEAPTFTHGSLSLASANSSTSGLRRFRRSSSIGFTLGDRTLRDTSGSDFSLRRPSFGSGSAANEGALAGVHRAPRPARTRSRINWLYLATRSERDRLPVLIWPALSATARSGDEGVLGLARAMADDRAVAGLGRHAHGVERLRQRADLIQLHEDGVAEAALDAATEDARRW